MAMVRRSNMPLSNANGDPKACGSGYCYMGQGRNITASLKRRW
ncbi:MULTISPECIES: hypothetical protein [Mesorhizobium]|nr:MULTISPECIES: hypothetical protein [Mesorhizobium]ESY67865.1 hypothetical protein X742_13370 [Mesorhizobium sp. LNHC232B00]